MSEEDPTKDITTDEMLRLILGRLDKLEAQSANTTRPMLDQIIKEMIQTRDMLMEQMNAGFEGIEKELAAINNRLDIFCIDISKLRGSIRGLDARLAEVESRPN